MTASKPNRRAVRRAILERLYARKRLAYKRVRRERAELFDSPCRRNRGNGWALRGACRQVPRSRNVDQPRKASEGRRCRSPRSTPSFGNNHKASGMATSPVCRDEAMPSKRLLREGIGTYLNLYNFVLGSLAPLPVPT